MQKAVIITGVSGGIGSALAKAFDSDGYSIVGTYFSNESETKNLESELNNPSFFYKYDMTNPSFANISINF